MQTIKIRNERESTAPDSIAIKRDSESSVDNSMPTYQPIEMKHMDFQTHTNYPETNKSHPETHKSQNLT